MLKQVLVIGTAEEDLRRIVDQLRDEPLLRVSTLLVTAALNGALQQQSTNVDLLIVCCRNHHAAPLDAVAALPDFRRPPILVCGDIVTHDATRLMVRLGVRDLLPPTPTSEELLAAVRRALRDGAEPRALATRNADCISVIGAAGGVGASFIACSLAHLAAAGTDREVLLIDLDLLFAPISAMLGLRIERPFTDASEQMAQLDGVALDGYTARHASGLHVMSSTNVGHPAVALGGEDCKTLLALARRKYDLLFVAANRWLDTASASAITDSSHVLMVMGPILSDVRNAVRLRGLLVDWLGVSQSSLQPVINRMSSRTALRPEDIAQALGTATPFSIPEDIELVRRSIDSGVPVAELQRSSALVEALMAIESSFGALPAAPLRRHPFRQLVSEFFGSDR